MAEELTTNPTSTDEWSQYEVKPTKVTGTDEWSQYEVKKKPLPPVSKSTSLPLVNGGQIDPVSLINTSNATAQLAPVTDNGLREEISTRDEAIRQQKLQRQEQLSNNLKKIRNAMPESDRANIDKAIGIVATRTSDGLSAPTKEEQEHNEFMDTKAGKLLGGVAYVGSKATKGTLQIAKGISHLVELSQNPMKLATGQESGADGFFKKADELANFGLTKSDVSNIEEGTGMGKHALAGIGMMAEFAPSIALGEATAAPKAVFYLQGLGQGKDLSESLKKQGKDLNPLAKEALIQGSGFVNMILSDLGDNLYGKLPSVARGKIATGIVADAIKESAGKDLTYDSFKSLLDKGAKTFAEKFEKAPIEILNKYNHTAATLGGLNVASFALHKGVDKINDTPVFNETAGDLAEGLVKTVTQDAPMFTALGAVPEMTKLTPYSSYKNDVVESIVRDPSVANVDALKAQIANHASEQNWTQQELSGSLQHIEQISAASKKLPSTIEPSKKEDAIGLIIDRDGLAKKLQQVKEGKQELDPAIADVPTAQEQYLTDKIEQANDKIRSIVTGKKVTYSKDETNPEKPKFFKTTDGNQENIEQSRYDLENTERQLKTISNEEQTATDSEKVLPEQPQANEARKQEANSDVPVEQGEQGGLKQQKDGNEQSITTGTTETDNAGVIEPVTKQIQQPEAKQEVKGEAEIEKNAPLLYLKNEKQKHFFNGYIEKNGEKFALVDYILKDSSGKTMQDVKTIPIVRFNKEYLPITEKDRKSIIKSTEARGLKLGGETEPEQLARIEEAIKPISPSGENGKVGDPLRTFAAKVREGKISKLGGFKSGSLFDVAWDGSLEVVATTLETGAKLADAIEAGLKHIRKSEFYKGLPEKDNFEQQYRSHFEKEYAVEAENASTTTLRNADVELKRAEYGFDKPLERRGTTDAEFDAKADAEIKKGYDAHALMDKILLDKQPISGVESVILAKFQGIKEAELLNINDKIEKATESSDISFAQMTMDRDRILDDLQRAYNASEASGTIASDALRARKVKVAQDDSLAGFLVRERSQVNKGEKLSQEQIKKVSDEYSDIQRKNKAYQKKIAELEAQLKSESAGKSYERIKAEVALENRRLKREIKISEIDKDITDVFASLKKIAREKRSMLSANPIPIEYIPEIAKLVKLFTQKGVTTLEGIVDNIYNGLKDDIEGLTKDHVLETIGNLPEAKKADPLKAIKSRLKSSIRKVETKTANNDFTPTKRNRIVLDAEALDLRDQLEKARYEYDIRLHRDAYANRTNKQKTFDAVTEVLNTPRALLASTDFSAPLRQGLVPTISHPVLAAKAFNHMFKAAISDKSFDRWFYDLREADDYHVMKDAKLYISDPHKPEIAAKEEQFMHNWAEKIPVLGKLVRGSERAYVGYLNKMRVDLFRQMAELQESQGKTPANSPEIYKGIANFVNNSTGRGNFTNENLAQALNIALFSPRLIASRLNLLNPVWYAKLPKEVRYQAIGDMAKFIGVGVSILGLAKANGFQVEADPRSADFGKIRKGDKRWDIWGGFSQYIRLFAQELTGQTKSTSTGEITDLGGDKFGARTRLDVLGTFFRNKLSPVPALAFNALAGKDAMGQDFDPVAAIPKSLIPLTIQDTYQAVKQEGLAGIFTTGLPTTFGVGVQTYSDLKPVKEVEAKPEISLESGVKYKLTEQQLSERKKFNDDYLAKNGERLKKVFTTRALNDPELSMEINTKVTKYKQMGQSREYILAHKKELIDKYVTKRLSTAANKYSKSQMLKKYRVSTGKYNLEKSEE